MNGKLDRFSLDTLINLADRAGPPVSLRIGDDEVVAWIALRAHGPLLVCAHILHGARITGLNLGVSLISPGFAFAYLQDGPDLPGVNFGGPWIR
jgi:hypothetical protein